MANPPRTLELPEIPAAFIIEYQGKDYITANGLIYLGHLQGLKRVTVEVLVPPSEQSTFCLVRCEVETDLGIFSDYGEVNGLNKGAVGTKYPLSMATTRARNRALRIATHCPLTSYEEMDGHDDEAVPAPKREVNRSTGQMPYRPAPSTPEPPPAAATEPNLNDVATAGDINRLRNLLRQLEKTATIPPTLTHGAALVWLRELSQEFNARAKR